MNKVRGPSLLYSGIFALLTTMIIGGSVLAISDAKLQENFDDATRQVNRARGLTLAILKQIKELDAACRSASGTPIINRKADARNRMGSIKPIVDAFHANADGAESLLNDLSSQLDKQTESSSLVAKLKSETATMKNNLKKYQGRVGKYWKRSINDFGQPAKRVQPAFSRSGEAPAQINAELTFGLGMSKYKRPNGGTNIDASSSDVSLGLKGLYTLNAATTFDGYFNHKTTTERREIGLTDFGAAVNHQLSPQISLKAGFDVSQYSDKENDVFDYSQKGFFAQLAAQTATHKANIQIRQDSRGYSNLNSADYSTLSFIARDMMSFGTGNIKMQLRYLKKTNDVEALDHTEMNPSVVYHFSPGGSQLGVSYQQFTMPNLDDSPMESNRLKVHFYSGHRTATGSKRWGPEINMYKYPNRDDADMTDFKLISQSTSRGKKTLMTQWNLVYRMYDDTLLFDFAQVQYRNNSRPVGSGRYSKFNFAARYYIEASDEDDPLRFNNVHPAHTLDIYYSFGWAKAFKNWLRTLSIGPILATKAYIDTERSDAFDEDVVEVDFLARNPRNTVRVGLNAVASLAFDPGITGRAELSYIHSALYNADPMRTTSIFELKIRVSYPVDQQWFVDGYTNLHSTRVEIESAADLDKTDIGVQVRYLFDVRP